MELIEIIYDIAILGAGLLIVVVIISYISSRASHKSKSKVSDFKRNQAVLVPSPVLNYDQGLMRRNVSNQQPLIFHVDQLKNKELKIVRKPTFSSQDIPDYHRESSPPQFRSDNMNGARYTIVNDELTRYRKPHVINF